MINLKSRQKLELYNLRDDIGETRHLSKTDPFKLKKIATFLIKEL